ncbi:hypothetical protein M408DRAFT_30655 [Serendipita vermifera MAFF 305830]|uniref:Uncharacterized protein n=1 Tax=Serendipita vermifera MAFF 305830 TaxID=933852 RepID=A0A0C2WR96_SERVB|nr:hypothetical protein M408DRAFT_30655 [Serendipita vermifera MAFF 305830]
MRCGVDPVTPRHSALLSQEVKAANKVARRFSIRATAINQIICWAGWKILEAYPLAKRSGLCILFTFDSIVTYWDPWVFRSVNVTTIDWTQPKFKALGNAIGFHPFCEIIFGDNECCRVPMVALGHGTAVQSRQQK